MNKLGRLSHHLSISSKRSFTLSASPRMAMRSTMPPIAVPDKLEIHLTDVESSICDLLNDCSYYLQEEKGILVTCRIAGGWVRDKLLGSQSNDIDVALSSMMGLTYAEHLAEFARSKGVETGTIAKIEVNPDQSKHLETATFKIYGLDLDLVNLRSEEYADDSRIPTEVSFGTPVQDALRRDITINALFYNVHTREVEDYTEMGLDDLRHGIIRTPSPAKETFQDDPLRVLRCVRFSSRFGFDLVQEVKDAARDLYIQEALVLKVARERVGDEVGKMLKGPNPLRAAQLIHELHLYQSIFFVIPQEAKSAMLLEMQPLNGPLSLSAPSILDALTSFQAPHPLAPHPLLLSLIADDNATKARLYLASLCLPYLGFSYQDAKKKTHLVVTSVIRDSLKFGVQNHYLNGIPTLFSSLPLLKAAMNEHKTTPLDRIKLGLLLRNKLVHNPITGNHWTTSLLFSLVTDLVPHYDTSDDKFNMDAASEIVASYNAFVNAITDFELQDQVDSKPLLNGHEIGKAFGVTKVGPWIGKALEDVVVWHLGHPQGSKDECAEWLKAQGSSRYITEDSLQSKPAKRIRTK